MELLVVAPVNWILILKWVRKSGPDFDLCPTLCREVGSPLAFLFLFGSSAFFTLRESRDSELSIRLSAAPAWIRCPPFRHCAGLGAVSGLHVRGLPNRWTDIGKKEAVKLQVLKWQVNFGWLGEGREKQASPTGGCPTSQPRTQQLLPRSASK